MAQINSVEIKNVPEYIDVGDNESDIDVEVKITFHKIDIKLEMAYILDVIIYDIHGPLDVPVVMANWKDTKVIPITQGRKDKYMGFAKLELTVSKEIEILILPVTLKLGKLTENDSHILRRLDVFATLTPAVGRCSKWSAEFESYLLH
ncbi:hypothetical protein [Arenibacter certesii]|uniref:Uncharacterized protein n=1 Tax=Arenibacter certesii TaxID=228955 RepID=A0A918MIE1_9FLAO|nr:hypothetical protein [Arenibacter certesii]GGW27474.1 hypothetical protein GCM10007383_11080 [Arenibacter certesii]